jgi:hypothetical protein
MPKREFVRLSIPHAESALIARIHRDGQVLQKRFAGARVTLNAKVPPSMLAELEPYRLNDR